MSITATQTSPTGTGLITHATAVVRGTIDADVSVYHARTDHARIGVNWGGVLINIFSAAAARGLFEAFTAAPSPNPGARARSWRWSSPTAPPMWWCLSPARPEVATAPSRLDLHMGPVTFQVLDQAGCLGTVALLRSVHHTAIQVFLRAQNLL
jgi:hypothetical protein